MANKVVKVQAEFDQGLFLRTHILRPTWHLVAAQDVRWIVAATSWRVQRVNSTIYRQEGLDQTLLDRCTELIIELLRGGRHLTRTELGQGLASGGIQATGLRLAYVIMNAELEAVICSGPMRGASHTYGLLDERASPQGSRDGDLPQLARRFIAGHGPASAADLARWASLTTGQAGAALAEVSGELEAVEVDGVRHWFDPAVPEPAEFDGSLLLPLFDEVTLSYPLINFSLADHHPQPPGTVQFIGSVIVAETNVGLWRRVVKGQKVIMEVLLSPTATAHQRAEIAAAADDLGAGDKTLRPRIPADRVS